MKSLTIRCFRFPKYVENGFTDKHDGNSVLKVRRVFPNAFFATATSAIPLDKCSRINSVVIAITCYYGIPSLCSTRRTGCTVYKFNPAARSCSLGYVMLYYYYNIFIEEKKNVKRLKTITVVIGKKTTVSVGP